MIRRSAGIAWQIALLSCVLATQWRAADAPSDQIHYIAEMLPNGLRVVYVPQPRSPVVHVRVLYHVGSRDERPDRQGFAHMFEHMMFGGSAHVRPQEHQPIIQSLGGECNAQTGYDYTRYFNTVPAGYLETALYLEADRMASFKVSQSNFDNERKVVNQEWLTSVSTPLGESWDQLHATIFRQHPYRWSRIGDMKHLAAATPEELQNFFDTYYVPSNAAVVLVGGFELAPAKQWMRRYFGWIAPGDEIHRSIPQEAPQTQAYRDVLPTVSQRGVVMVAFRGPEYHSPDHASLTLVGEVLANSRGAPLYHRLRDPIQQSCDYIQAWPLRYEDASVLCFNAGLSPGTNARAVAEVILNIATDPSNAQITALQLQQAKTRLRLKRLTQLQSPEETAALFDEPLAVGLNPGEVNQISQAIDKVTFEDLARVTAKYLTRERSTTLILQPATPAAVAKDKLERARATTRAAGAAATKPADRPTIATSPLLARRHIAEFPSDYPASPPIGALAHPIAMDPGHETIVNGVRVLVLRDTRIPLVSWMLVLRQGSSTIPGDKAGLDNLTWDMMHGGTEGLSFDELEAQDPTREGVRFNQTMDRDATSLSATCGTDQLDRMFGRFVSMVRRPSFPEGYLPVCTWNQSGYTESQAQSPWAAPRDELSAAVFGEPLASRAARATTIQRLTLEDVKQYYANTFHPGGAILAFAGDITVQHAEQLAKRLLDGWTARQPVEVKFDLPAAPTRHVILIDRPAAAQSTIMIGCRSYTQSSEDQFAGYVASHVLATGPYSRLGRLLRSGGGLAYGVWGGFYPARKLGAFVVSTQTGVESTVTAIDAIFGAIAEMKQKEVTDDELAMFKRRAAGVNSNTITLEAQLQARVQMVLADQPSNFYDVYPLRVADVTAAQVRQVMNKYVDEDHLAIIVAGPAARLRESLGKYGHVKVIAPPAEAGQLLAGKRPATRSTTQPRSIWQRLLE